MECLIKNLVFIFLLLLLICPVLASPPSIPVTISGKIFNNEGVPISNALVSLSWIDSNNKKNTISTLTVFSNDKEINGNYAFNQININEKDGTYVILESYGSKVELDLDDLSPIIRADITLSKKQVSEYKYSTESKGIFDSISDFFSSLFINQDKEDSQSNLNFSSYDYDDFDKNPPNSPTENNSEVLNQLNHSNDINSKINNSLTNSSIQNKDNISSTNSGHSSYENSPDSIPKYSDKSSSTLSNNSIKFSKTQPLNGVSSLYTIVKNYYENEKRLPIFIIIIVLVVILVLLLIFIRLIFYLISIIKSKVNLESSFNETINIKGKYVQNKNFHYLNPEDKINSAIELFIENTISAIPIISSGEVIGVITKKDILKKLDEKNIEKLEKTKISSIMNKKFLICDSKNKLEEIYNDLKEKENDFVLIKNKSKISVMDYFDILKTLYESNFLIENPPNLSDSILKKVPKLDHKSTLSEVKKQFLNQDEEYIIITKDEKPIGILTTKNLIEAINHQLLFDKTKAINIMSANLITMNPGNSIYEAFDIMLERRFNQLPILLEGKLVGIVSIKSIVDYYYNLLKQTTKKKSYEKLED